MDHPDALLVNSILTTELDSHPCDSVPDKSKKWLNIISNEIAKCLPEHTSCDYAIDLKIGETHP
jgi:hypothetical protein